MKKHLIILALLVNSIFAEDMEIVYTQFSKCKSIDKENIVLTCPSPLKNWSVTTAGTPEMLWYVFKSNKYVFDSSKFILKDSNLDFPTVEGSKNQIEWHLINEKLQGVIFKVSGQDLDLQTQKNMLMVLKSNNIELKFCGFAATNKKARELLSECKQ